LITLAAIAALFALSAPTANAATKIETVSSGPLTAQMTYKQVGFGWKNVRITILRNDTVLLDRAPSSICTYCVVWPGGGVEDTSVHALRLDATPEPEAIFDLYTGGAHCCLYSLIFRYDPATNTYVGLRHEWFNAGYRFFDPDKDGIPVLLTRDDRFAYKYESYAGSQYPPQIWSYDGTQLLDVTRQFPSLVRKSARSHRNKYNAGRGHTDVRAALAVYVADQCLLGDCSKGFDLVRKALARGYLSVENTGFGPGGRKFIRNLRGFLRQLGYL
jgi:hypothetical protein